MHALQGLGPDGTGSEEGYADQRRFAALTHEVANASRFPVPQKGEIVCDGLPDVFGADVRCGFIWNMQDQLQRRIMRGVMNAIDDVILDGIIDVALDER